MDFYFEKLSVDFYLKDVQWIFLDCQTTGMRPSSGELLELAWAWQNRDYKLEVESRILKLQTNEVPARIARITGISSADLAGASDATIVRAELLRHISDLSAIGLHAQVPAPLNHDQDDYKSPPLEICAVIHHSPFEIPFLERFFEGPIPFQIVDSAKIAKRLLPRLPSCNLRALAGHFGEPISDLKRAGEHARATADIWQNLLRELKTAGVDQISLLREWLNTKPAKIRKTFETKKSTAPRFEYSIDRDFRLGLPNQPGVYRMVAGNGRILYVGKATSLRSRVNSYFRGQKGRDRKKLEMLTQVKHIDITRTDSALEAAVLENEEIKRLNPPYNISLKKAHRRLFFYDRAFSSVKEAACSFHCLGPFRPLDGVDRLRQLTSHHSGRSHGEFPNLFFVPAPIEILVAAFGKFCSDFDFDISRLANFRSTLAWAHRLSRRLGESEVEGEIGVEIEEIAGIDGDDDESKKCASRELTLEEIIGEFSESYAKLFLSAARAHRQALEIKRLMNCRVEWKDSDGASQSLEIRNARYPRWSMPESEINKNSFKIEEFDRLNVLRAELRKQSSVKIDRYHSDVVGDRGL